jgi:WD40 repeat protein
MSQQQKQDQKLKSLGLRKVGFAAVATSILSVGLFVTKPLFFQDHNSYEAIPEKRQVYVVPKFEKLLNEELTKISDVNFSPDGQTLASASYDGTVKLWNVASGKKVITLYQHSGYVSSVSFSPDGERIASANADKSIKIWSRDGSLIKVLRGHDAEVTNVSFCPDNQIIVSSSADKTISLWKLDGKLVKTLTVGGSIRNVDCSPDSNIIAVTSDDNIVRLWNRNGQELQTSNFSSLGSRGKISFVPHDKDGDVISAATRGQGKGGDISIDTKSLILKDGDVISAATRGQGNGGNITIDTKSLILKDGDVISFATYGQGNGASPDEHNASDLKNRDSLAFTNYKNNHENADKIISSNDNSIVASISGDNTILLSKNGSLLNSLKHNKPVRAIAFHPNHKILASGCDDGTIYIWNVNTGQLIRSLKVHERKINKVDYSLDGRRITSASDDGIVKVWYPDSSTSKNVIVAFFFVFSGVMVLLSITKRRQNKRHKNTSNTQKSYIITGWVICVLPEDWRGDLEALRYELIAANKPKFYVRFITVTTLLDMLYGGIRVKLQNLYYGDDLMAVTGRRSITDSKDKSITHNNLNE